MGALEENKPVSPNEWETVKRQGDAAIKRWIDDNMRYRSCVVVLIGTETAYRPWVKYEIEKAWSDGKGLFGIYIHNLRDPRTGICAKGPNPFSNIITCYDPSPFDAYGDIKRNMERWVEQAIAQRG
jgi:hypothetical protein